MSANVKRSFASSAILFVHTITSSVSVFLPRILTVVVTCYDVAVVVLLQY